MKCAFLTMTLVNFCFLAQFSALSAADVRELSCDKIDLRLAFGTVTLSSNKDGGLSRVQLVGSDFDMSVPLPELAGIESARLQTVRVTWTGHGEMQNVEQLKDDYLVVCLEFGIGKEVAIKSKVDENPESQKVWSRVFFIFNQAGYSHRDRLIAKKYTNEWTILYKEVGVNEIENGSRAISVNDQMPWDPPSLPVKN